MAGKADIKLGYTCNNHCVHCVIADQRDRAKVMRGSVDRSSGEFLREIEAAREQGLSDVVFTGGEPTIRRDLPTLMKRARQLGFRLHVQTNGRMFSYRPFAERLAPFGATYVIAVHGPDAETHDRVTESKNSFDQTIDGIRNLTELGQGVVGKMVLSKLNFATLSETVGLLVSLGVPLANVAFPHALGYARQRFDEVIPRYRDVAPHVHQAIERHGEEIELYFEAMPLCLMVGYEKHVSEYACATLKRPAVHKQLDMDTSRDWQQARREQKAKFPSCRECRYDQACEGPWREYPERFGSEEFVPVPQP